METENSSIAMRPAKDEPAQVFVGEGAPLLGGSSDDYGQYKGPLLFIASFIHLIGNTAVVVGDYSAISLIILASSYSIAFLLYALYVYKAQKCRETYVGVRITVYDFTLILLWSISAGLIPVLIG
ncbi:18312_t:CDS:2, partial [Acaulospora morrowiae]